MITAVAGRLREEWSPQQISGFMAPLAGVGVSHQWIYSLIRDDKTQGGDLRQPKRRSKHRAQAKSAGLGKFPNWEGDTVIQGHKRSGLVVISREVVHPEPIWTIGGATRTNLQEARMNTHKNARLTPHGRALLVRRVLDEGLRPDVLTSLKGGDSHCWRATSCPETENIPGRVHVPVVERTTLRARLVPYSQPVYAL